MELAEWSVRRYEHTLTCREHVEIIAIMIPTSTANVLVGPFGSLLAASPTHRHHTMGVEELQTSSEVAVDRARVPPATDHTSRRSARSNNLDHTSQAAANLNPGSQCG